MTGEFDRLRPHRAAPAQKPRQAVGADREGKRALFSPEVPPVGEPPVGAVRVDCSACEATTVLTPRQALRAALPSVHLPFGKRNYRSWMRCPACRRRTWVRVGLR
jgi:hypothetical protein